MKKKPGSKKKESYKKWVSRMVAFGKKKLSLQEWTAYMTYEKCKNKEDEGVAGTCEIKVDYLWFNMCLYPAVENFYNKGKYEEAFETILHELCHVYTEPMYLIANEEVPKSRDREIEMLREQGTTRICSAILKLIPEKDYMPLTNKK